MKKYGVLIIGSAVLCSVPLSLHWLPERFRIVLVDTADARIGRPLTPFSVAGVNRRVHRRAYYRSASYGSYGYRHAVDYGYPGYGYGSYSGYGYDSYPGYGYGGSGYSDYSYAGYGGYGGDGGYGYPAYAISPVPAYSVVSPIAIAPAGYYSGMYYPGYSGCGC